jgi:hypothetical protein
MKIYIDENTSPRVAKALHELERGGKSDSIADVSSIQDAFGKSIKDTDLIPKIANEKGIWITRDAKIMRKRTELEAIRGSEIGVFVIYPGKKARHWDMVLLIINSWTKIKDISNTIPKPFAFKISTNLVFEKINKVQSIESSVTNS